MSTNHSRRAPPARQPAEKSVTKTRAKGGGRKRRTDIDKAQAIVWFRALAAQSGLNASQLEEKFPPEKEPHRRTEDNKDHPERSLYFARYGRGETSPQKIRDDLGGVTIVDHIEKSYPGTAAWFHHPLWRILQADIRNGLHDPQALDDARKKLPEAACKALFGGHPIAPKNWRRMGSRSTLRGLRGRPPKGHKLTLEDIDYLLMGELSEPDTCVLRTKVALIDVIAGLFGFLIEAKKWQQTTGDIAKYEPVISATRQSFRNWEKSLRTDKVLKVVADTLLERAGLRMDFDD